MPSVSAKQKRFMAACANGAGYESCPPEKVSREFNQADKRKAAMEKIAARRERKMRKEMR